MKKLFLMLLAAGVMVSFVACKPKQNTENAEIPNPWKEAKNGDEAAEKAGVGYLVLPENGTELEGGRVDFTEYRYMEQLLEVNGSVGAAELKVRKGLNQNAEDVSGDYTEYKYHWDKEVDFWTVHCFGNVEGKTMKAVWISDNFAYSIYVRGQGDEYDKYGLGEKDIEALVQVIQ